MRNMITSALLRKLIVVQLFLALVPFGIIARLALDSMAESRAVVVSLSEQDFDAKSFEALRARDVALARSVAAFLSERETDLKLLASLPRTPEAYLGFGAAKQGTLWAVGKEGMEQRFPMPLYRELAFIDAGGQEMVKVTDECGEYPFSCKMVKADRLTNVSNPANTLYKSETFFAETKDMPAGGIYVGRPVGAYLPYERAYAGAQNRLGERFRGVIRFATPVFEGSNRVGVVVLSLEMIHFIEQVAHVAPANSLPQAEVDAREADLTYVVDPDGWAIAHPRHFSIGGVDGAGQPVPAISEADRKDPDNLYRPGNLAQMGFIDRSFPEMVKRNQNGEATAGATLSAKPTGSRERAMAYATIPYYSGRYSTPAGFGLVIMSTDGARFHLESDLLGKQIENRVNALSTRTQWVGGATAALALLLAVALAVGVARPILRLTAAASSIETEAWEKVDVDRLAGTKGRDEIARLTRVFASMAREVRSRIVQLREQVQQLQIIIDEHKRERSVKEIVDSDFFQDLTQKAQRLREQRARRSAPPAGPPPRQGES